VGLKLNDIELVKVYLAGGLLDCPLAGPSQQK